MFQFVGQSKLMHLFGCPIVEVSSISHLSFSSIKLLSSSVASCQRVSIRVFVCDLHWPISCLITPYTFHETFTCTDTSLIYCSVCNKCGQLYIGLTSNSLRALFCAHRHSSATRRRVPLYCHFARKSHDFLRDHRIVLNTTQRFLIVIYHPQTPFLLCNSHTCRVGLKQIRVRMPQTVARRNCPTILRFPWQHSL